MARKNRGVLGVYESMLGGLSQLNVPPVSGQAMKMAAIPMSLGLQWQADFWKAAAPASAEWIARRQEGAAAALEALEKMSACGSMAEAAEIQKEWFEGAMRRLEADFRMFGAQATAFPQEIAKVGRRAVVVLQEARTAEGGPEGREAA